MHVDILYVSFGQRFGPQQVAVNLLENLLDQKKLTILGVVDKELAKALSSKYGRDNFYVPKNSLSMILTLFVILLKNKPRVCHFNFPPLLLMPLVLMKIQKTRIVYSFHGGILFENTRKLLKSLFFIQCKYFYDIIIANSKYSAQFLLQAENSLEKKLVIIPNGIKVYERVNSTTKNIKGQPAVLYVGRIEYIKGVDILVKAISLVKKRLPKICLHIVGGGTKLGEIKKLIDALGIKENVVLHGFLTEREKNSLYLACDMVVVPSRNEPFGITVLEAMRAGKPLIVSNRGALPELVKHNYNGIVVELKPEAFAQAILTLIKDKNLMTRISEANKLAVKFYDWEKISEDYIRMYETLIDKSFNH